MKKILSLVMTICMIFAMGSTALAADANTNTTASDINLIKGTWLNDPTEDTSNGMGTQAITEPTSLAPLSWYNVNHTWTAAANGYTWSSYIFDYTYCNGLIVYSPMPFTVTWYNASGGTIGTAAADEYPDGYYIQSYMFRNYYIKISNPNSTPVTSSLGAYYILY